MPISGSAGNKNIFSPVLQGLCLVSWISATSVCSQDDTLYESFAGYIFESANPRDQMLSQFVWHTVAVVHTRICLRDCVSRQMAVRLKSIKRWPVGVLSSQKSPIPSTEQHMMFCGCFQQRAVRRQSLRLSSSGPGISLSRAYIYGLVWTMGVHD